MISSVSNKKGKVGAVLVIGGGIAGIQTSIDLAESGQKVYLLESSPSIGGCMSRLDKTFPTNDCSMCILSPKLVETGRHLNIEIITCAELESAQGEAGKFSVILDKKPRFVDGEKCTGCGTCVQNCPVQYALYPDAGEDEPVVLEYDEQTTMDGILGRHHGETGSLMAILKETSVAFNYLPENILAYTAQELNVPLSLLHRICTFYSGFSLTPKGRNIIRICLGTTCYVRGAKKLLTKLRKHLGVDVGQTTPDMRYTLESVRCLGCCSLAPVITVGAETYAKVKQKQISGILEQYE